MTDHAVDATLDGSSTQTVDATANYPLGVTISGGASQSGDAGLALPVGSTISGGASQSGDAGLAFLVNSTLSGDASYASNLLATLALQAAFAGDTSFSSDVKAAFALGASLVGSADLNTSLIAFLTATLAASGSGFTVGDLLVTRLILANLQAGGTFFQADITWTPHPGAPSPMPSVNGATTLQQFIDATGSGKSKNKTPSANNGMIDLNPPRKPFKPK